MKTAIIEIYLSSLLRGTFGVLYLFELYYVWPLFIKNQDQHKLLTFKKPALPTKISEPSNELNLTYISNN